MSEWVLVKKRLPEECCRVLITVYGKKGKQVRSATYYTDNNTFSVDNGDLWKVGERGLIAWMLLPEPYRAKRGKTDADCN